MINNKRKAKMIKVDEKKTGDTQEVIENRTTPVYSSHNDATEHQRSERAFNRTFNSNKWRM